MGQPVESQTMASAWTASCILASSALTKDSALWSRVGFITCLSTSLLHAGILDSQPLI